MAVTETEPIVPFRWNLARREQLGRLGLVEPAETYRGFLEDLRTAAAKVLARSGDSDLVFLGRSPETLFDYLSGILADVARPPSLTLLQWSSPAWNAEALARRKTVELEAMLGYLEAERLDPRSIASYGKPVRFIDVVSSGHTFATLLDLLAHWSHVQGADFNVVLHRIGFVGLIPQGHNSPNTWRWWQRSPRTERRQRPVVKNVSVPGRLWSFIANCDLKVTPSHRIERWSDPAARAPTHLEPHLAGLALALQLFDVGRTRQEREQLARRLSRAPEMREAFLRGLVLRLRGRGG